MGGRHRTGRSRRAGWFVAAAFLTVVALVASVLTVVVRGRSPEAGPDTDPESGVTMRNYPVPQPTPSSAQRARHLRDLDTAPPTTAAPASSAKRSPSPKPTRSRPVRRHPTPSRRCYVFRYNGHTYRFCPTRSPGP